MFEKSEEKEQATEEQPEEISEETLPEEEVVSEAAELKQEFTDENGNELATDITELLRLRITLPEASSGTVTIHFEIPAIWRAGDIISLLTLAGLAALAVLSCRKRKEA